MISVWNQRPVEVAHLLNPPFCAVILYQSIRGFEQEAGDGMPYPLSFLVLPLVLHKPTRDLLPRTIATKFHSWVHKNQSIRVRFHLRAHDLVPHTKEALHFGADSGFLVFSQEARLNTIERSVASIDWPPDSEPAACTQKAHFIGRWFARAGEPATIFAILGVMP